jgi:3-oxoacyl-[acyl-carrier protein] reductase
MGRATAHLFAREGANVAVTDLDKDAVNHVVDEIKAAGFQNVHGWALDVSRPDTIKTVVDDIARHFGGLDILINNAGISAFADVSDEAVYERTWERAFDILLTAHQRTIRAALPYMRKQGWGRIVNIASTEGLGATPGDSPYVAAKHGVIGLSRGLAVDLGREGITVNCICPGPIRTSMTASISDEHKDIFARRRVPLRRYGLPEEVAHITLSCVLPAASYLNGVTIPVDGGMTVKNA